MKKQKSNVLGIISSLAIILSAFMPFMSRSEFGISYAPSCYELNHTLGLSVVVLGMLCLLFSRKHFKLTCFLAGGLGIIIVYLVKSMYPSGTSDPMLNMIASNILQPDSGYYLMLGGSIGLILYAIVG